jgi:hypothetical protein
MTTEQTGADASDQSGDRVMVNVSAGILPGSHPEEDWQPGTVVGRNENGQYRIMLDGAIAGRQAEKDAAPEHMRRL